MKTGEFTPVSQSIHGPAAAFRSGCRLILLTGPLLCALVLPLRAATVNAIYNSPTDIPIEAPSYTATGNTILFSLNFVPTTGTSLTVIRNKGLNFIQGKFDNLAHGQTVTLNHGGRNYDFTANYYAHEGRDLVLQWTNVKPFAWGGGANGKLGNNSEADSAQVVAVNSASAVWGKLPFSGAAGGNHSLGLCSDGTVVSWGLNTNGQLGNNSTAQSSVPVAVSITGVPSTRTVTAVSAGANHSLALCSDGKVVSWGLNTNGQLGNNSTAQSNVPVNVDTSGALAGRTVVAVSAGNSHSLALCSDGTVVSWGLNANGQLGNNSTAQSNVPVAITGGALAGKTVMAVSAGASHSLALSTDGTVVSWGLNTNGQLGNNSTVQSILPVAVTTASGALNGKIVRMISAGESHSLALCIDGTIASWGSNSSGQLGNANNSPSSVPVAVSNAGVLNGKSVVMVSAGANHSLAHCSDGTVATWGLGTNGELGNNSTANSNTPVSVDASGLQQSGLSGVISGSAANHSLAIVAAPQIDISGCGFNKWINYSQSSMNDPVLDPDTPYNFTSYVNPGTMSELLSSSTLTLPPGATGAALYEKGSNGLWLHQIFRTKLAMDAAYPQGTYLMSLHTSTPNTYHVELSLGADNYPAIPKITNLTNATWNNGVLKVINPANDVIIQWNNPGNDDSWFQIENTNIRKTDSSPTSSFTIPGNALGNNSLFRAAIQHMEGSALTPIPGQPDTYASSGYHTEVRFLIQVGTPPEEDPPMTLLLKSHNQAQYSNADPVDSPNILPDSDLAPYSFTAESPAGGSLLGPSSTSFPLIFCPESDGVIYEYLSSSYPTAAALNASYPDGTYTFPGGITVSMPGDSYPVTAKILTVNGATPVWTDKGQLALDPTIDNTITWSDASWPDFGTQGHQTVEFENHMDFNFVSIDEERGAMAENPTPITSLTIPKSTMTPTYTYLGSIGYAAVPAIPVGNAIGAYQASNQFMAVALKPQTISFGTIPPKQFPGAGFALGASATSGLPVTYEVISGPATISGNTVTLVGAGTVTIRASQAGTGVYATAVSVTQSFEVTQASMLAEFRATNGLAPDGSQDLQTPAADGVPNLLKYAFNMIGTGPGQATSLTTPNVRIIETTGNAGLPRQGTNAGKLTITYLRRKAASSPGVTYAVEFSNTISAGSWAVNGSATEAVTGIDTNFERVTVTDNAPFAKRFARVRVIAD